MKQLLKDIRDNNVLLELVDGKLNVFTNGSLPDPRLIREIKDRKEELIRFLSGNDQDIFNASFQLNVPVASLQPDYPLTSAQRGLWVLSRGKEINAAYNMPEVYVMRGSLDFSALSDAFRCLIARHEILRTVFRVNERGEARQMVLNSGEQPFALSYIDLRSEDGKEQKISQRIRKALTTPFNLSVGPLIRAGLYQIADDKWIFTYVMHHIICDGWSMTILIKELLLYYNSRNIHQLPSLRIQYKDYAVWQQAQLTGKASDVHKRYWMQQFEGELPVLQFPAFRTRPPLKTYHGEVIKRKIGTDTCIGIRSICQAQSGSLFMGLLTAINILLYKYTSQNDIIIGTPIAGRQHVDLEDQIGLYLNTLALRTRFVKDDTYASLLEKVKIITLGAYEHQAYPFDELVDQLSIVRDMSRNPLFDVMVVLQNNEVYDITQQQSLDGLTVNPYPEKEHIISKFDLIFTFEESGDQLDCSIEYNTDIYDHDSMSRLADHLDVLMRGIVKQPSAVLDQLPWLNEWEEHQLLTTFNHTAVDYPSGKTIVDLFEEQVKRTPGDVALICEDRSLTYDELNKASSRIGRYLRRTYDIRPDDMIGVMLDRSDNVILSILAVLKAGAAYVPVDPDYPRARKEFIIKDTRLKVLITQSEYLFNLEYYQGPVFAVDIQLLEDDTEADYQGQNLQPHHLAYVMYTSGSSGDPKGVMIEHRNVVRLVRPGDYAALNGHEVLLSTGAISFDATTFEFWGMLLNGGKLIMCSKEILLDEKKLQMEIERHAVDTMWFTAGWFNQLVEKDTTLFAHLTTILVGGDKLSVPHINKVIGRFPDLRIINGYGPTENTTFSITYVCRGLQVNIPIGKPIHNSTAYILGSGGKVLPIGVTGEICVGGDGLARGYLNNPDLTAEKFITNPFTGKDRLYRTGDLGKWMPDGTIEFTGRADQQVKIRGYRVEPGEIEDRLGTHPEIKSSVVIPWCDATGEKELVAYFVSGSPLDAAELRKHLMEVLPAYMVPGYFIQMETLPLTGNGKVDKRKLPAPDVLNTTDNERSEGPSSPTEARLTVIWQDILGKKAVGLKDDFFEIGGHSLKATRLLSRIQKELEVTLDLNDLFTHTILEDQAQVIDQARKTAFTALVRAVASPSYPLSSSQQRIWVLSQFEEGNIAYNMPGIYVLEGNLDETALEDAFRQLIGRHEILRTVFRREEDDARQLIIPPEETDFHIIRRDLRQTPDPGEHPESLINDICNRPFDLAAGPLLRAGLFRTGDNKWILAYAMHHIACDGWSMDVLMHELSLFYNANHHGEALFLPSLPIQYKDYAVWQRRQLQEENMLEHRAYWIKQFESELPVLDLAGDHTRPVVKTYNGASITSILAIDLTEALTKLARRQGATLFMGLLASVNTLLYRYTGNTDITIGSPIAGRQHADLEGQIGFYVNTLALRMRFNGNDSFIQLLDNVRQITLDAYYHQAYPFDELVTALDLPRDTSRNPLFDVMVVLQNASSHEVDKVELDGVLIDIYDGDKKEVSKFDLLFNFKETEAGISLVIDYNTDIFRQSTIERLAGHWQQLLVAVIDKPEDAIDSLDILSVGEKWQLLHKFGRAKTMSLPDKTVIRLFEEQVIATPDASALVFEEMSLSYRQLNEVANQLGNYLRNTCMIAPDDMIGISQERSEWLIISILAVLKAGGAYVPIDPEYPKDRVDYMVRDSGSKILIDKDELLKFQSIRHRYSMENPDQVSGMHHLAYVIYTSGSTGNPKGVMIEHASLLNLVVSQKEAFGIDQSENILQISNISFDASVEQIFMALTSGATLHVISTAILSDATKLKEFIDNRSITHIHAVPALLMLLPVEKYRSLRRVISGGDRCPKSLAEQWGQFHTFYNEYGPTETTVTSIEYLYDAAAAEARELPIGQPLANTEVYILRGDQLTSVGVTGEICIGGAGLARGYLNNETLTQEKFVENPFRKDRRIYRTGDLGRWLSDGNIEFGGRKDHQVKIRGFRIEPGEVESILQQYPDVRSAVVAPWTDQSGEKQLVAYLIAQNELDTAGLKKWVAQRLPTYMMPVHFIVLTTLPLNHNGKVDRKKLPDPVGLRTEGNYMAPRTITERELAEIWKDVLGKEIIGVRDDFFEMGGHSLKASALVSRIHKKFSVLLTLKDIFSSPDLEAQAQRIVSSLQTDYVQIPVTDQRKLYPLSSAQRRLWSICQLEEGNVAYNMPGLYMLKGFLDREAMSLAFLSLINRHESLRTVFREDEDGRVCQVILSAEEIGLPLEYHDIREGRHSADVMQHLIMKEFLMPFNLMSGPLLRIRIYHTADDEWLLSYVMHHIISDGWSMRILIRELVISYNNFVRSGPDILQPLRIQYKDYAVWQQQQLRLPVMEQHRIYWQAKLSGDMAMLTLPVDFSRPSIKTFYGAQLNFSIQEELVSPLRAIGQEKGMTLFMMMAGVLKILLYYYTGQKDITIGTPVSGREHSDLDDQIGFYVNTLLLRDIFEDEDTCGQVLDKVKDTISDALDHGIYPFDMLVDEMNRKRDLSMNPFFEVMMVYQDVRDKFSEIISDDGGLKLSALESQYTTTRFDINFDLKEYTTGLEATIEYNTDLYERTSILLLRDKFLQLLSLIPGNMEKPICGIRLDQSSAETSAMASWDMNF